MNLMIQPNQICLIVKLYNYRPELLPDSNDLCTKNDIMIIKLIELNNFKGFEDIQIPLNEKINIIIGENNAGKSSIFEAILLWKKCS